MKKLPLVVGIRRAGSLRCRSMRETTMRCTQNVRNRVQTYPRVRGGSGHWTKANRGGAVSNYAGSDCVLDRRRIWFLPSSPCRELSTDLALRRLAKVCRPHQVGLSKKIEKWNLCPTETTFRRVKPTLANPGKDEMRE